MLDLLISIMMTLNIHFTVIDENKIQISSRDAEVLFASSEYQKSSTILPIEDIVIADEVDPTSSSTNTK